MNTNVKIGDWLVVAGAGGGLGHLAGEFSRKYLRLGGTPQDVGLV
jgi:D-arabinose 1-dehydrogenase-like Zn-dependent alcohol dehydrogenase